mmetsp:Transcript_9452/g.27925  ORF Transcript_9452/g.27925 Transcript_9452/m.27925 type:complete len:242 (-) Transcript_9452:259-984(-)
MVGRPPQRLWVSRRWLPRRAALDCVELDATFRGEYPGRRAAAADGEAGKVAAAAAARAAAGPGVHQSTSGTLRSTCSAARVAVQSTGALVTFKIEGAGGARRGSVPRRGSSTRYSGSCVVILERRVRAPTSSLGDARHTGTTLCASTSKTGVEGSAATTSSFHARGTRSGLKSVTIAQTRCCSTNAGSCCAGGPLSSANGSESARSSASTSSSPASMKPYWRIVASKKVGTRQKTTESGTL